MPLPAIVAEPEQKATIPPGLPRMRGHNETIDSAPTIPYWLGRSGSWRAGWDVFADRS